jgi:diphosphomevalonate decarboxylase
LKNKLKATAKSPANIAFIKFWGKRDPALNLPFNNSISMNLSECFTTTGVEFGSCFREDRVIINGKNIDDKKKDRVVKILDKVRSMSGKKLSAQVISVNNFPSDAGIASSASAFSALALASSKAIGLNLSLKSLSILARLGSGSACRSVIDGFAEWRKGTNNTNSYAVKLATPDYWQLVDIIAVVDKGEKKTSSTEGHEAATSSPYFKTRQLELKKRTPALKKAFLNRDIKEFGTLLEEEAVSLHVAAMTSKPPIFYWNKATFEVMETIFKIRERGLDAYFTMDAGPNVHILCLEKDAPKVERIIKKLPSVLFTIANRAAKGTELV